MTAIFKHRGDAIDYIPGTDVAAGDVIVLGDMVAVAKLDIKAGERGTLHVSGVFDFPKATGSTTAFEIGTSAYWNAAGNVARNTGDGETYKLIGKAVLAAGVNDTVVRIRLSQ